MGWSVRGVGSIAASFMVLAAIAGTARADQGLVPHRAVYDLSLDPSVDNDDVADLTGRMVMEFTGSDCAGYKMTLRFVTEIEDSDGEHRVTDSRSTSFERADGKSFEFSNQTYIDQNLTEESRGSAERTSKGTGVSLLKPGSKHVDLGPSVVFPTQQIEKIVSAAKTGESFVQADVYDGSDDGETVYATATIIGRSTVGPPAASDAKDEESTIAGAGVSGVRAWPVTISYFDRHDKGEQTPTYIMSYLLYENGISRDLKINYGGFAVAGRLSALKILQQEPCK